MTRTAAMRANELAAAVAQHETGDITRILNSLTRDHLKALAVELAARIPPDNTDAERITRLAQVAARRFGTTSHDVLSGSRRTEAADARAVICYTAHRLMRIPSTFVGRQIGRDHSTVLHACTRVGEVPRLRIVAEQIAAQLGWHREEVAS